MATIQGETLPADVEERRDFFNIGFGGEYWQLPPVMVGFQNPLAQWLLRLAQHPLLQPLGQRALKWLGVSGYCKGLDSSKGFRSCSDLCVLTGKESKLMAHFELMAA